MIKAVGKTCPALKEILFCELLHANATDPKELREILKSQWPKVYILCTVCALLIFILYVNILIDQIERVTFCKVSANYCETVLDAFESELKELTFVSCENIDVLSIMPCTRLEKVTFLYFY